MLPPIPSHRELSISEIAEHWHREIDPPAPPREIREEMIKAWLRRELPATGGPQPIEVLRSLHGTGDVYPVLFVIKGDEPAPVSVPRDDGGVDVDVRVRLPVPNGSPATWNDDNCQEAFEALANDWSETRFGPLAVGLMLGITIRVERFFEWLDKRGSDRPTFWTPPPNVSTPTRRERPVTEVNARGLYQEYSSSCDAEALRPTQHKFEKFVQQKGFYSGRRHLRKIFKEKQAAAGKEVRRGRPKNSPAEK
jgi:hypothetical protein